MDTNQIIQRARRVALLDAEVYAEVEEHEEAVPQGALIVAVAMAAAGLGSIHAGNPFATLVAGLIMATLGWVLWVGMIWCMGKYVLTEGAAKATPESFFRTVSFAAVPGAALVLGVLPGMLGYLLFFAVSLWMVATTVLAVQQSLFYADILRSAIVVGVAWIIQFVLQDVLFDALTSSA